MKTPDVCPACGADVPRGARACPECGSDEKTGWSEKAQLDTLGIPDPDEPFDYDDFVKKEFGGAKPQRKGQTLWIAVAAGLVLAFIWFFFGRFF